MEFTCNLRCLLVAMHADTSDTHDLDAYVHRCASLLCDACPLPTRTVSQGPCYFAGSLTSRASVYLFRWGVLLLCIIITIVVPVPSIVMLNTPYHGGNLTPHVPPPSRLWPGIIFNSRDGRSFMRCIDSDPDLVSAMKAAAEADPICAKNMADG